VLDRISEASGTASDERSLRRTVWLPAGARTAEGVDESWSRAWVSTRGHAMRVGEIKCDLMNDEMRRSACT